MPRIQALKPFIRVQVIWMAMMMAMVMYAVITVLIVKSTPLPFSTPGMVFLALAAVCLLAGAFLRRSLLPAQMAKPLTPGKRSLEDAAYFRYQRFLIFSFVAADGIGLMGLMYALILADLTIGIALIAISIGVLVWMRPRQPEIEAYLEKYRQQAGEYAQESIE